LKVRHLLFSVFRSRFGIFQAIGEYDKAITLFRDVTERQADFASMGALAVLHAELGDTTIGSLVSNSAIENG
jgi:hypothetical protein